MADFNYDDLPLAQAGTDTGTSRQIRVLQVQPRYNHYNLIRCSLTVVKLSGTHTALSYTWGPDEPRYTVDVNGKLFSVRQNLYQFLCVASKQHHSKPLWIDAISINQSSTAERNDQVAFMSDIYYQAKHVLVWLGQNDLQIELALRHFPHFSHDILFEYEAPSLSTEDRNHAVVRAAQSNFFNPIVAGLRDLCNLEYWERRWIVQEFRLSEAKTLMYGSESVSAEALSRCLGWYHHLQEIYPKIINGPTSLAHAVCTNHLRVGGLHESHRSLAHTVLRYQDGKCTDYHDHIYALRSIFAHGDCFPVDYAIGKIDLLIEVLKFCSEELFLGISRDLVAKSIHEYLQARDVLLRLLDFNAEDFSVTDRLGSAPSSTLSRRGTHRFPSFFLDLPLEPRVVGLEKTTLMLHTPNKNIQALTNYIARTIGIDIKKDDDTLHCFFDQYQQGYPLVRVYSLKSAGTIFFCFSADAGFIDSIIRFEYTNDGQVYPIVEIYPEPLDGVTIVPNGGSWPEERSHLVFDGTQSGILAGVTIFGLPRLARQHEDCFRRLGVNPPKVFPAFHDEWSADQT